MVAANWWYLWYEDRARQEPPSFARHSFLAAREGFALPDIRIWPAESRTLLECCPYEHAHAAVRFLNRSDFSLDREAARDETIRLVEAVLDKLSEKQIAGTCLQEEWRLITHSESNEGERTFCECAARLGIDPYALGPQVRTKLEELLVQLPVSVLQDFFDSADPAQFSEQADPLIAFFRSAEVQDFDNVWKHIPRGDRELMATLPAWRQGYEYAHFLRNEMDLNGQRYANIDEILASLKVDSRKVSITSWPTEQMDAVTGLSARQAPVFSLSGQRTESRNFAFCRALGEHLQSEETQHMVLTRRSDSLRQKRSRAFAAEFLAPAQQILALLTHTAVTDEDCEDIGREFGVSSWVIQRQIVNHRLANYVGPPFWGPPVESRG